MSASRILVVPRIPDSDRLREAYDTGNGWMGALAANGLDATLAPLPTAFDGYRPHENPDAAQEHIREAFRPGVRAVLLAAVDPEHSLLSMHPIGGLVNDYAGYAYDLGIPRWVPTDRRENSFVFGVGNDTWWRDLDGNLFPPKAEFYQCIGRGPAALEYMVNYVANDNS